jgi:predicted transcriptional regulator
MAKPKFSDSELKRLVRRGLSGSAIAEHLGVSKGAVSMRLKALNLAIARNVTLRNAGEIVEKEINAAQQLQKINAHANEILDLLMRWNRGDKEALQILESQVRYVRVNGQEEPVKEYKFKDPRELALKAMQEIRSQLSLQLQIFESLYNMQAVAAFQNEVLDAIASVSPELREQIVKNLQERRAIRSTLELSV